MKLSIGIPNYLCRGVPDIVKAQLRGRKVGKDIPLIMVSVAKMVDLHRTIPRVRGCARYMPFDIKKEELWLHPNPDGEYHLEFMPAKSGHTITLPKKN